MLLNREVGDPWMVAIVHNNLGNATRGLGDYDAARGHYADSLRAYRDYDDRWALAFLLEDIGVLAALSGDAPPALELIGAADALRESIGAPRAPSLDEEIREQMAPAVPRCPSMIGSPAANAGARSTSRPPSSRSAPCGLCATRAWNPASVVGSRYRRYRRGIELSSPAPARCCAADRSRRRSGCRRAPRRRATARRP